MKQSANRLWESWHLIFAGYLVSFFLTVGADSPPHYFFRLWFGVFLLAAFFLLCLPGLISGKEIALSMRPCGSLLVFSAFTGFEIIRFFTPDLAVRDAGVLARWVFYLFFFGLSFSVFTAKKDVRRLLNVMSWSGLFVALNALPPLLMKGRPGYVPSAVKGGFFHPVFYFHPWVSHYLLSRFAHKNWTGDVMAFGLFPLLGLIFYSLDRWKGPDPRRLSVLATRLTAALLTAAAILLLSSRGTTVFLAGSFMVFLLFLLFKFFSGRQLVFTVSVFVLIAGFAVWAGDFDKVRKRLATLQTIEVQAFKNNQETDPYQSRSVYTNIEGAKRALRIYHDHPVWGVGTGGYAAVSEKYATPGLEKANTLSKFAAMCFYLQLLAEEGMGAYLYFLFLAVYLVEMGWGLFKTKSRFKFIAALSLFCPVLLVFGHASINHLMQNFSFSMLVYISMGASLAVLRPDFQHEVKNVSLTNSPT